MIKSYLSSSGNIDSDTIRRNVCDLSRQQNNEKQPNVDKIKNITDTIYDADIAREKAVSDEVNFIRNDQVYKFI